MNSMKLVIPLHFISWKKTPNDAVTPQRQSQFTTKMNGWDGIVSYLTSPEAYCSCVYIGCNFRVIIYTHEDEVIWRWSASPTGIQTPYCGQRVVSCRAFGPNFGIPVLPMVSQEHWNTSKVLWEYFDGFWDKALRSTINTSPSALKSKAMVSYSHFEIDVLPVYLIQLS